MTLKVIINNEARKEKNFITPLIALVVLVDPITLSTR
jgi:hypothetical protein